MPAAFAANPAGSPIGSTPAEINASFPATIRQNLAGSAGSERFALLTDHEVFKLAQAFSVSDGNPHDLAAVIADPVQRARYVKAAAEIAPAPVLTPRPVLPRGGRLARQRAALPLTPNVGMTLDEIYMVFRTGQAMSVTAALYSTSYFVGLNISKAWGIGWATGSAISYLLQNYAPGVDNGIGATLAFLMNDAGHVIPAQWAALLLAADGARYGGAPSSGLVSGPPAPPVMASPPVMAGPPQPTPTITIEPAPTPYYPAPDGQLYYPALPPEVRDALCHNVLEGAC
jgi:hypothetical protein